MEYVEQIKGQVLFHIEHSQEYIDAYTDFFNKNILDISKSFYPDDDMSPEKKTRIILIVTVGAILFVFILLNVILSVLSKIFFGDSQTKSTEIINKKYKTSCLFLGDSGAGKTALFARLVYGPQEELNVHTSVAPNSGVWIHDAKKKKGVGIIDAPGNKKVSGCWRDIVQKGTTAGVAAPSSIVFVIDSNAFSINKSSVSEFLYDILSDNAVIKKQLPVHIFCNKSDLPNSSDVETIKSELEKELTFLRKSFISSEEYEKDIMDTDDDDADFKFDDALCDVSFSSGSARTYEMDGLLDFIKN